MAKTTAIRAPTTDPINHQIVLRQLKEASETASRLRGNARDSFAQVGELLDAGIVRFVDGKLVAPSPSSLPPTVVPSTRQIKTGGSIQGGGTLTADLSLELVGDVGSPGNNMLYGTNATGVKGWYTQPAAATTLASLADVSISGLTNGQVLAYNSTASKWENQAAGGGSGSNGNVTPDTHPTSPTAWDDEFEYGTGIDLAGARFSGAKAWSWFNQQAATALVAAGSVVFKCSSGISTTNIKILSMPVPTGNWTFAAKIGGSSANVCGMFVGSPAGKFYSFGFFQNNLSVLAFNSVTSYSNTVWSASIPYTTIGTYMYVSWWYVQIGWDGTNLTFSVSPTGVAGSFIQVYTITTSFLGVAPSNIGLCLDNLTAATALSCDWFRRTA